MAKKKKRRSRDRRMSILTMAGLFAAFSRPISNLLVGNLEGAVAEIGARFTGYNFQSRVFDWKYALANGYAPIIFGVLGSKVATKLGVNRAMKNVPYVGKMIKL